MMFGYIRRYTISTFIACTVFFFFFFQAEDGIRDDLVTGVQTCALPISPVSDGAEGLRVLRVLDTCQIALHNGGVSPEAFKFGNEKQERSHFTHPTAARTNGDMGLKDRAAVRAPETFKWKNDKQDRPYFVHESAYVDEGAEIGAGSKVWHFSHIMKGARIAEPCIVRQNLNIDRPPTLR